MLIEILRRLVRHLDRPVQNSYILSVLRAGKEPAMNSFKREFGVVRKGRKAGSIRNHYVKDGSRTRHWQKYTKPLSVRQFRELGRKLAESRPGHRLLRKLGKSAEQLASAVTVAREQAVKWLEGIMGICC